MLVFMSCDPFLITLLARRLTLSDLVVARALEHVMELLKTKEEEELRMEYERQKRRQQIKFKLNLAGHESNKKRGVKSQYSAVRGVSSILSYYFSQC